MEHPFKKRFSLALVEAIKQRPASRVPMIRLRLGKRQRGFTLVEIMLGIALVALILAVAVPTYTNIIDRMRISRAVSDIQVISMTLTRFRINNNDQLPDSLAEIGKDTMLDPYGQPYSYFNIANATGNGSLRKDRNLVPINSDYDLYSVGRDGRSVGPLTAGPSHDDIVRANDGAFIGLAIDY